MTQTPTPIHEVVRVHYAERIKSNASCCGPQNGDASCCSTDSNLYPADLLATLPEGETAISYGCGDPITLASLEPGQTVLDLGSGAGLDCFFAAKKVGETGWVIGVDMTPEMIERAQSSAKRLNVPNVDFRQGWRVRFFLRGQQDLRQVNHRTWADNTPFGASCVWTPFV